MRFFNPPPPLAHRFREHSKVNSRNFLRAAQPESVAHKEHTSPSKDIEERSSTKDDYGKHTRHSLLIHGRLTTWWRGSAKRLQRMEKRKINWTSTMTQRCEKKTCRIETKFVHRQRDISSREVKPRSECSRRCVKHARRREKAAVPRGASPTDAYGPAPRAKPPTATGLRLATVTLFCHRHRCRRRRTRHFYTTKKCFMFLAESEDRTVS